MRRKEIDKMAADAGKQRTLWQETWRRFKKNKLAMVGLAFILLLVVIAFSTVIIDLATGKEIYNNYVIKQDLRGRLEPPSLAHPFGKDEFGRDMLFRMLWAVRYSLFMGTIAIAISCVVGGILGAVAGYYGGRVDNIIMRVMDILLAIPSMLLAIANVAAMGTSITNLLIAIAISYVPTFCSYLCQNRESADSDSKGSGVCGGGKGCGRK